MKSLILAKRSLLEFIREPINLIFSLGFPLVLILLLSAIQANIPVSLFEISNLTPGITVFGLSFISLFSATIISKDRSTSFLTRLYTTPIKPYEFIFGYTLPFIPVAVMQAIITYLVAFVLGLCFNINVFYAILFIIPVSLLFISIGLLCGSLLSDKAVGGICGALLTNLTAWLSGVWFDLELVGGAFLTISKALPFYHAVELERLVLKGSFENILTHLIIVLAYTIVIFIAATLVFIRQMKKQ
ncbi:MAG: ABC transporter permease [Clostridia bacterium]|nr:ABC transporter permease [Clostridia bacterium]